MRRKLLWFTFLLGVFQLVAAQDVPALMRKAEVFENSFNEAEALKTYQQALRIMPTNQPALIKCSELCSRIGFRQTKPEARDDYYRAARKYAELALKLNEKNPDAHVAIAIALGRTALVASAKEKVAAVKDIKLHAERALELDNNNFKAYHILGKWHFEVWNLNGMERTAIKLFFGGIPKASLQESISYYEKTRALEPKFLLNYLELAKAYDKNDQRKKAKEILQLLLQHKNVTEEDNSTKKEAQALLTKWN